MKKILALTLTILLIISALPFSAFAEEEKTVYLTVEASTIGCEPIVYPVSVTVNGDANAQDVFLDVMKNTPYEISYTTDFGFYLVGISGTGIKEIKIPDCIKEKLGDNLVSEYNKYDMIGDGDFSTQECFMYSVNNTAPAVSMNDYSLQNGDVIRVQLSLAWGADVGMGWGGNFFDCADKTDLIRLLADLKAESDSVKADYTSAYDKFLTVNASQNDVDTAVSALQDSVDEIKSYKEIKIKETAEIITKAINARKANDKIEDSILSSDSFLQNVGSSMTDWTAISMGRFTSLSTSDGITYAYDDNDGYAEYLKALESYVENTCAENDGKLSTTSPTTWHRISLAILALGGNPQNVGGINLIADGTYNSVVDLDKQGLNAWVWGLITLSSADYNISQNAKYSREMFIEKILSERLSDGGWAYFGETSDVDMTSMAITSLAPYYEKDERVKEAVDGAVALLSSLQCQSGGFESFSTENSMTTAQVVIALTSVGINPDTDERFISEGGKSVIDGLLSFECKDGGFRYDKSEDASFMSGANDQALEALVSYYRLLTNQTALFDFSDVYKVEPITGDADCDGKLTIKDVTAIQRHIAEIVSLSQQGKINAEVTGDGKINIQDATKIQYMLAS
ncbi:MAG: dockerin type I domain-containing protein [Acutalibacteraceae bacterium]